MSILPPRLLAAAAATVPDAASTVVAAPGADAASTTVSALLARLPVAAQASSPADDREASRHWVDADADGDDTREEVLIAHSTTPAAVGPDCAVSGTWVPPYAGATWTDPSDVDVDHVVALSEA